MEKFSVIIIHLNRLKNLHNVLEGLKIQTLPPTEVLIIEMGKIAPLPGDYPFQLRVISFKKNSNELPLAAARNFGRAHCKNENLVFLDVDCIPSSNFCEKIINCISSTSGMVMGTPRYMLPTKNIIIDDNWLKNKSVHHPNRPIVENFRQETCYELFWSLCFAISINRFDAIGGFDENYKGYGIEDTDFAQMVKKLGVKFFLCEALVFHQQHPIYQPPLNHIESIVQNANRYFQKWGEWAMLDCLIDFENLGYVNRGVSFP